MNRAKRNETFKLVQELQRFFLREYERHHCSIKSSSLRSVGAPASRIGEGTISLFAGVAEIISLKDTDVPNVRHRLVRGTGGMATDHER
jgi:hypothetical protein